MGFVVPLISLGIAAYGANEQRKAAQTESTELLRQAKAEELSATQRQIERRRSLLRALGSQNAAAGAGGIGLEGSVSAIAKADIRDARNDLLIDKSNTDQRRSQLQSQAKNTRRKGTADFVSSIFGATVKAGQAGAFGGGGSGGGSTSGPK